MLPKLTFVCVLIVVSACLGIVSPFLLKGILDTAIPNGERNSSGYFVEGSGVRLMMDCGAGTLHAMARYGLDWEHLTHIFLSHFHVDHIGELAALP